ncbi:MAG: hypothetical protein NC453_26210 [Muribaculum sp.]|nr:hypothetical protein [Muribaculum sp.]
MKKLLITIFAISVCLFVGDRLVGKVMWWVNQHSKDLSAPKLKYLAKETDDDLIFMGTSRCNQHYIPKIIEDSIGMKSYNGGIDASNNIYAQYTVLNIMLQHHVPKAICLDLMASYYSKQRDPFNTISFFAPYIGNNAESDSIFRMAGTYNLYKASHIMRYNAKAVSNLIGMLYSPHAAAEKGYIPAPKPPKYPSKMDIYHAEEIDPQKMIYLQKFIDKCTEHNIKLIFCISPMYSEIEKDAYKPLYDLAERNNIPLLDYHSQGLYQDHPEYFKDNAHLWDAGAREFSTLLGHDLKKLFSD